MPMVEACHQIWPSARLRLARDVEHRVGVGQHRQDDIGARGGRRRVGAHVDAVVAQRRRLLRAAVPGADVVARASQVAGHGSAHHARAQCGDGGHVRHATFLAIDPEPVTLSAVVHRAVVVVDPEGDAGLEDLLEPFEDDDEPLGGHGAEIAAQRIAEEAAALDPEGEDPGVQLAAAVATYLAFRRDEIDAGAAARCSRSPLARRSTAIHPPASASC